MSDQDEWLADSAAYESPRVEREPTPVDLEHEIFHADPPVSSNQPGAAVE